MAELTVQGLVIILLLFQFATYIVAIDRKADSTHRLILVLPNIIWIIYFLVNLN